MRIALVGAGRIGALHARTLVGLPAVERLLIAESALIADRAERAGVPVRVGFQRRFDPAFGALREAVARASCGRSHVLRVRHADTGPPPPGYAASAGSMFVDMCIHDYDAVRWVAGEEVAAVGAVGARLLGIPELERHGDIDTAVTTRRSKQ